MMQKRDNKVLPVKNNNEDSKGIKMYKHHEEALQFMKDHYREQRGVIAFIFGGSVEKGMERENFIPMQPKVGAVCMAM